MNFRDWDWRQDLSDRLIRRAKQRRVARETMRRLRSYPWFLERQRKGRDALSPDDRARVIKAIQSGQNTYDIANDWLIAPSTVRGIKHKEKHR